MRKSNHWITISIFLAAALFVQVANADPCTYVTDRYITCPTGSPCVSCGQGGMPQCRMLSHAEKETQSTPCVLCTAFGCDVETYGTDEPRARLAGDVSEQTNDAIHPLKGVLKQLDDQDLHNLGALYRHSPLQFEVMALLLDKYKGDQEPVTLQIVGFNPIAGQAVDGAAKDSTRAMLSAKVVERMRSWFEEPNMPADGRVNEYVEASLVPTRAGRLELTISSWPTSAVEQNERAGPPHLRSVVLVNPAVSEHSLDVTVKELSLATGK